MAGMTYELTGLRAGYCWTCQCPIVIMGAPLGPVTITTDAEGQRWLTQHREDCPRLAEIPD